MIRVCWWGIVSQCLCATALWAQIPTEELRDRTLEELLAIPVTLVSRVPEPAGQAPAAIWVITAEDVRRSGATRLTDLLRLVPGVIVGRIDGSRWAIGIRGFPDRLARAMLVMIDGRTVYSPLFAGTYWEVQDVLLEDVERIEVVRGPGGTLWGANAASGTINIITRHARDTRGGLITAGAGVEQRALGGIRWGGGTETRAYRMYAKTFLGDATWHSDGSDYDKWGMTQAGFRADWTTASGGEVSVHGDIYGAFTGSRPVLTTYDPPYSQRVAYDAQLSGGNLVARWSDRAGAWTPSAQVYYDRTRREELAFQETRHTADVDLQVGRALGRHQLLVGGGYRASYSQTASVSPLAFLPADRLDPLASAFVQDQFALGRRVDAMFGVRVERNRYSGFEAQPSARLTWRVDDRQTVVGSLTRAVRTPSRVEQELVIASVLDPAIPRFLRLDPNPSFEPEKLTAVELEYRLRLGERVLLRAAPFLNRHRDLLSTEVRAIVEEVDGDRRRQVLPLTWANGLRGMSYGTELAADVRPTEWLRVNAHYGFLRIALSRNPGSGDVSQERAGEGTSPRHQVLVRSSLNLGRAVELDWAIRHVTRLRAPEIPGYTTSDVRLGWRLNDRLAVAIVGTDLPGPRHLEFAGGAAGNSSIERSVHGRISWTW